MPRPPLTQCALRFLDSTSRFQQRRAEGQPAPDEYAEFSLRAGALRGARTSRTELDFVATPTQSLHQAGVSRPRDCLQPGGRRTTRQAAPVRAPAHCKKIP